MDSVVVESSSFKGNNQHQFLMKATTTLILLMSCAVLFAQKDWQQYEASTEFPFGQPNPEAPQEIKDFAPMIGECDCDSQARNPDGTWQDVMPMVWRFKYIMNGYGVQDETLKADGGHSGSIRQFIADSSKWYVHYYSNKGPTPALPAWEGGKVEDKIILFREQKAPNGMDGFYRITFYDMSKTGYKWLGEWVSSKENPQFIYPTWKITCTKRM